MEDGKTHRPIMPAGRQPKSRPLICRSNIREALGWRVGWLVGRRQRSAWREEDAEPKWSTREIRKESGEREVDWARGSGWVDGAANDTSLGNFNFAEITVGLIRIKRSSRDAFSLSFLSRFCSLHHPRSSFSRSRDQSGEIHRQPPATLYATVSTTCVYYIAPIPLVFLQFRIFPLFRILISHFFLSIPRTRHTNHDEYISYFPQFRQIIRASVFNDNC